MNRASETVPEYLYHYYDESTGPFRNLSDLPQDVNPDGELGPLRYIEAQFWSDELPAHLRRRALV